MVQARLPKYPPFNLLSNGMFQPAKQAFAYKLKVLIDQPE